MKRMVKALLPGPARVLGRWARQSGALLRAVLRANLPGRHLPYGRAGDARGSTWPQTRDPGSQEFEPEISAFELEDARAVRRGAQDLFVGSSSVRLWASLPEDFPGHAVVNRGFGGARIRNIVDFEERVVFAVAPARIVFFAGSNDLDAGAAPRTVLQDFRTFVARVQQRLPETRIAFVSITPSPARFWQTRKVRDANRLILEFVNSQPMLRYIDVHSAMLDGAGRPRPELYVDELHPSRAGYLLWIPRIAPFLRDED